MESFLEEEIAIGAEVELGAPADDSVASRPKRKSKILKKAEKQVLIEKLRAATSPCDETVGIVIKAINNQDHIHIFKERETFWNMLQKEQALLCAVFQGLVDLFVSVFKSCEKGKDRYSKFQIEWHKSCSMLLMDKVDRMCMKEVLALHQQWLRCCAVCGSGHPATVYNPVMISLCSATLMHQLFSEQKEQQASNNSGEPSHIKQDTDDVYYRFGGAAIATMLHLRQEKVKNTSDTAKQSTIKAEMDLLKGLECTDKSQVPQYLQYRDRGYMHFPKESFIPFFRAVDQCILEHANENALKKHGSKLVEVATHSNKEIEVQFKHLVSKDFEQSAVQNVYLELTRKLCNTRLQEFIDACISPNSC